MSTSYEKCTVTDEEGKRVFHNVNGVWYNELMTEGEWSLYEVSKEMWEQNRRKHFGRRPRVVVVHSRIYQKTRPVYKLDMPVMWCGVDDEDKEACVPVTHTTEKYDAVCHTELFPSDSCSMICHECGAEIPDKFVTLWRLMEPEAMDQTR
jgi:hypothetical protein